MESIASTGVGAIQWQTISLSVTPMLSKYQCEHVHTLYDDKGLRKWQSSSEPILISVHKHTGAVCVLLYDQSRQY